MRRSIWQWVILLVLSVILSVTETTADELSDYGVSEISEINNYVNQQHIEANKVAEAYNKYRTLSEEEFSIWKAQQEKEYAEFKNSIVNLWHKFEEPTNKDWVEYSKDKKSYSSVDFENGIAKIEILKTSDDPIDTIKTRVKAAVQQLLSSKGTMSTIPVTTTDSSKQITKQPILQSMVTLKEENIIDAINVNHGNEKRDVVVTEKVLPDGKSKSIVLTFPLTPDHLQKRMRNITPIVLKYCKQFEIDPSHVLATIHTESFFNPAARSHCGAIGLMQLMPASGGAEAYEYIKNKKLIPAESYLYDPINNIELGCAYISKLSKKYFGTVNNATANKYCTICAYNTGPGNVAFAFTGKKKVGPAIIKINTMDISSVYNLLFNNLPYAETRDYLQKVNDRTKLYLPSE